MVPQPVVYLVTEPKQKSALQHDQSSASRATELTGQPGENTEGGAQPDRSTAGDLGIGEQFGPFLLVSKLGEGGMGTVYKARHLRLNKLVAIKVLPPHLMRHPVAMARFDREMKAVGALEHPNIVRALDAGELRGIHYLVLELVEGQDLQQYVSKHGPMPVTSAIKVLRQAANALAYAHRNGLVHRDIKPSNLFLTTQGQIKILDLGLARLRQEDDSAAEGLTNTGVSLGTPDYMAPEQWADTHAVDGRCDLYALGCTLFFLLTGRAPYADDNHRTVVSKLTAHVHEPAPALAEIGDVPSEVARIYERLMAKNAQDRLSSAEELAQLLQALGRSLRLKTNEPADMSRFVEAPPKPTESATAPVLMPTKLKLAAWQAVVLGLIALIVACWGIWIIVRDKSGKEIARFEVPEGGKFEIAPAVVHDQKPRDWPFDPDDGKEYEWSEPTNLGPTVNFGAYNYCPRVSDDGLELWYVVNYYPPEMGQGNDDLFILRRKSLQAPWEAPQNAGKPVNTTEVEKEFSLSGDRLWLYSKSWSQEGIRIFHRPGTDKPWTEKPVLKGLFQHTDFPVISSNGQTLLVNLKHKRGIGGDDIWMAERSALDADWSDPAPLPAPVNSPADDWPLWLSKDGNFLLLASDRPGSFGDRDLWYATRSNAKAAWNNPINLGKAINSSHQEPSAHLSPDGRTLWFTVGGREGLHSHMDILVTSRRAK